MFFILQNEPVGRDPVQNAIIQDVLDHNKYSHSYEYVSIMHSRFLDFSKCW